MKDLTEEARHILGTWEWQERSVPGEHGDLWRAACWAKSGLEFHEQGRHELAQYYFRRMERARDGFPRG